MQQEEGANYFLNQSKGESKEESPIIVEPETCIRYFDLEKVFDSFFPERSLSLAKEKSTEERDSKHINDSSFTYGEVVIKKIYLYFYNN